MFIRAIHPDEFDPDERRFSSVAFEPSSDGGLSVFYEGCAGEVSGSTCAHLRRFYGSVLGNPPIFCRLGLEDLPEAAGHALAEVEGNDDPCHAHITDANGASVRAWKKRASKHFKMLLCSDLERFTVCDEPAGPRPLRIEDVVPRTDETLDQPG